MKSFIEIHPESRAWLAQQGLVEPEDFLRLEGTILGGHPDRHVLRLTLAGTRVLLKKEHRVSWRDRLGHWWTGHGAVSKSVREGRLLRRLDAAGLGGPQVLAHGEAGGRAFLLMREEPDATELRAYLRDHPLQRPALAQALGESLARLHDAGFFHRDLYSKHVLVRRTDQGWRFCFIDWQRGVKVRRPQWLHRIRDLATLDATLCDALATKQERLLCWSSYLTAQTTLPLRPQKLLGRVCRLSARLGHKRRIRELRQMPLSPDRQQLIWLEGEALCVTPEFHQRAAQSPDLLTMPERHVAQDGVEMTELPAGPAHRWRLIRRWSTRPWRFLASWWRRPQFPAPEFEQAAALIRLERFGVGVPRLLALGHRDVPSGQKYSFLLTELPRDTVPLSVYLEQAPPARRGAALREAGRLLRCVHEAGYAWRTSTTDGWAIQPSTGEVVLSCVHHLQRHTESLDRVARKNLTRLLRTPCPGIGAADKLRFYLGYQGAQKLTTPSHLRLARLLTARRRTQPKKRRPRAIERRVA